MLFADNNQIFCFPFNEFSLFLKLYEVRNTDKPGAEVSPMLEVKIISNGQEVLLVKYNIMAACFIDPQPLEGIYYCINLLRISKFQANDECKFRLYCFFQKLAPNIFLRLGNRYDNETEKFIEYDEEAAICCEDSVYSEKQICSSSIPDLRNIMSMVIDYNNYLKSMLERYSLWEKYCTKYYINSDWDPQDRNN